jgi:coenzyme Q-binding protein COQ10
MPSFHTTRRVRHSPQKMFDLVADVEQYPQFLPLCTGLKVKRRLTNADGNEVLIAEMQIGYKAIKERFTSRVTLNRAEMKIFVEYIDGPFRKMENTWGFAPVDSDDQSCMINFYISYEFASRTLGLLMGGMFDIAFRRFSAAFEERANLVYGS